ncbi:unnamed protein product [Cochlearia groenlandica]
MAKVTVISSTIVRPVNICEPNRSNIHLTPTDLKLLHADYPQRGLLYHKPDPVTRFISRLKTSLSSTLDIYFPFAGRLVKVNNHEDDTVSFYIDCNNGFGAKFVHAVAVGDDDYSVSVSDFLEPNGSVLECFFPVNGVRNIDGLSESLLVIQVTEFKDGIFVSFGYNHLVADGSSIWRFLHDWSKICSNGQGGNLLPHPPLVLRGWVFEDIEYPIRIPKIQIETERPKSRVVSTKERVFHFAKKTIFYLKAKANDKSGSNDAEISSLQAVLAYLWRGIALHSGLSREEVTYCRVAADFRRRLNPPLHKECFGNVALLGVAIATVGDLVDHGLGWAALQINKSVRSLTNESYRAFVENCARNVKIPKTNIGSKIGDNSLIVNSSPWFEVYDNDFGLGKPITVRAGPANGIGGKLVVFRGIEDGSIDVHAILALSLWSDELMNLLDDFESMENVTSM